jgi:hypothetical protein
LLGPLGRSVAEQLELGRGFDQPVHRHRDRPHRDPAGQGEVQGPAGRLPELVIERFGAERHGSGRVAVIGVINPDREAPGREPALPEPPAQGLGHPPEQRIERGAVVGVGREGVGDPVLGPDVGRDHRAGVQAPGPGGEEPAPPAEHRR